MDTDHPQTVAKIIKRSNTNDGFKAKQTFRIVTMSGYTPVMIINKLVLVDDPGKDIYRGNRFNLLKEYKGNRLYEQVFSIKLSTLNDVITGLSVHLPVLSVDRAEQLAFDLSLMISDEPVNNSIAGAFFKEGYDYARGLFSKIHPKK